MRSQQSIKKSNLYDDRQATWLQDFKCLDTNLIKLSLIKMSRMQTMQINYNVLEPAAQTTTMSISIFLTSNLLFIYLFYFIFVCI